MTVRQIMQTLAHTLLPLSEFTQRRKQFIQQMPSNSIALFAAAKEVTRSNDTEYPFCQNKNFYYLTGFNEPDAVLVLIKAECEQSILFCRDKDQQAEIWHGRRVGASKAQQEYGFTQCFTLAELDYQLPDLIANKTHLLYCQASDADFEQQIHTWLHKVKQQIKKGIKAPKCLMDASDIVHEMRLIKSEHELALMRQVNDISVQAHRRAMEKTRIGLYEYQIEAELLHEFARNGARFAAYNSIVAGGDNANILHYTDNSDVLQNNELLLIDAGGELAGYAADITRTFPINGKFNNQQKALYELVLTAQNETIAAIKPEVTFAQLNDIANKILTKGLFELGILTGKLADLMAEKACKKYFIHGLGHWLGLDVHDVGDYQIDKNKQQLRPFQAGMVLTIEPGIYIPQHDTDVAEKWRGIGIRIEDNIVVTDQGHENLSKNAPKSVADIEAVMKQAVPY